MMASLVTTANVRALVKTALTDAQLQDVIDRVEEEIHFLIGNFQDDTGNVQNAESMYEVGDSLFVKQPISAVVSVVDEDGETVDSEDYRVYGYQGRVEAINFNWDGYYTVTYKPVDQRAKIKRITIELARLDINRTAMETESVGGEYGYKAPNWTLQRRLLLRQLTYQGV
jgi:hypothetical protein